MPHTPEHKTTAPGGITTGLTPPDDGASPAQKAAIDAYEAAKRAGYSNAFALKLKQRVSQYFTNLDSVGQKIIASSLNVDSLMRDLDEEENNAAARETAKAYSEDFDNAFIAPLQARRLLATTIDEQAELETTIALLQLSKADLWSDYQKYRQEQIATNSRQAEIEMQLGNRDVSIFDRTTLSDFFGIVAPSVLGIVRPDLAQGSYNAASLGYSITEGVRSYVRVQREEIANRREYADQIEVYAEELREQSLNTQLSKDVRDRLAKAHDRLVAYAKDGVNLFLNALKQGMPVTARDSVSATADWILSTSFIGSEARASYVVGDPLATIQNIADMPTQAKEAATDAEALKKFIAFGKDIIASQYPELTQYSDDAALTAIYDKAIETGQSPDQYLQNTFLKPKAAEGTAKKTAEAENAKLVGGELSSLFDQHEKTLTARIQQGKEFGYADADIARAENQLTAMKKNRQAWLEIFAKEKAVNPGLTSQQFFSRIATPAQTATGGIDILSVDRPADAEGERIEKMFGETKVKSRIRTIKDPISGAVSYQTIPDDEADEELPLGKLLDIGFGGQSAAIKKAIASRADPATGLIRPMTFKELQTLTGNTQDFTQGVNPFTVDVDAAGNQTQRRFDPTKPMSPEEQAKALQVLGGAAADTAATNYRTMQSASAAGYIASQQQLSQTAEREQKARKPVLPKPRVRRYG